MSRLAIFSSSCLFNCTFYFGTYNQQNLFALNKHTHIHPIYDWRMSQTIAKRTHWNRIRTATATIATAATVVATQQHKQQEKMNWMTILLTMRVNCGRISKYLACCCFLAWTQQINNMPEMFKCCWHFFRCSKCLHSTYSGRSTEYILSNAEKKHSERGKWTTLEIAEMCYLQIIKDDSQNWAQMVIAFQFTEIDQ